MGTLLRHPLLQNARPERVVFIGSGAGKETPFWNCVDRTSGNFTFMRFDLLDHKVLRCCAPTVVVCSLFCLGMTRDHGDAVAIIERLSALHYTGRIVVFGPTLPRPDLVQTELRALGPGQRLTLITRDN